MISQVGWLVPIKPSLSSPVFIEVPEPSRKMHRHVLVFLEVSIVSLCAIFQLNQGIFGKMVNKR